MQLEVYDLSFDPALVFAALEKTFPEAVVILNLCCIKEKATTIFCSDGHLRTLIIQHFSLKNEGEGLRTKAGTLILRKEILGYLKDL
jgi:hypothetical protein